jgi:methylated-DNA-protein-cysteine methyltransferase-like protein
MPAEPSLPNKDAFNRLVWTVVRQIPPGKVATYGQIAALIPTPAGMDPAAYQAFRARWVGHAMSASPADVPWQRVINSQGKISLRRSGLFSQRDLLETEGVTFDERERIDLRRFGWEGPDAEFRHAHGLVPAVSENQPGLF